MTAGATIIILSECPNLSMQEPAEPHPPGWSFPVADSIVARLTGNPPILKEADTSAEVPTSLIFSTFPCNVAVPNPKRAGGRHRIRGSWLP